MEQAARRATAAGARQEGGRDDRVQRGVGKRDYPASARLTAIAPWGEMFSNSSTGQIEPSRRSVVGQFENCRLRPVSPFVGSPYAGKNPAAVALGRLGGATGDD